MSSSFFAKFSKPTSDNSLGVTTREAQDLANELRMRVFVIYFPDTDEFDYTAVSYTQASGRTQGSLCDPRSGQLMSGLMLD